jgi:hypothetical protein
MRTSRLTIAVLVAAAPLTAQQPVSKDAPRTSAVPASSRLDRSKQPTPGPVPVARIPQWTKLQLANGAQLVVTEKHDLPLVAVTVNFVGGSANFEPADRC